MGLSDECEHALDNVPLYNVKMMEANVPTFNTWTYQNSSLFKTGSICKAIKYLTNGDTK